ncbi:MAG: small multi-drug export protein [Clostridia bacterium]|nr:small multi-drug export protein [Clostridia bacterium]
MAETVLSLLQSLTDIKQLIVGIVSMIPLIELKGAIPIGEGLGLPIWESALIAYLGSTLIVIPVFFLLIPVFGLLKKIPLIKRFVEKLEAMLRKRAEKLAKNAGGDTEKQTRKMLVAGLLIFVSIPLPLTGVWTGAAIAVFLNMKFRDSIIPLALGNLIAGSIITLITYLFHDYVNYIITGMLIIALIMLLVAVIRVITSRPAEAETYSGAVDTDDKKSE